MAYSDLSADKTQTAYWNFCQSLDITTNIPAACDGNYNAVVLDQSNPLDQKCALNAINYSIETKPVDDSNVITLVYTNTDSTTNQGVEGLDVGLYCDENAVNTTYGTLSPNTQKTYYYTSMTNAAACPIYTYNALVQFVLEYKYLWGSVFILMGVFLAFFGRNLFSAALFIVAAIVFIGLILVIFYSTFLSDTTNLVTWIVITCTILVGLLVGFFAMKLEKIGACLLAGWGGFCCGVLLNETVLYYATSVALSWSINCACALVAAILAWFLFNHAIIISTALIGSYFTMRGVGLYAGGFPNEYVLMEMISTGEVA